MSMAPKQSQSEFARSSVGHPAISASTSTHGFWLLHRCPACPKEAVWRRGRRNRLLRRLEGLHFIGMDVVEVAPAYDVAEITSLAAATMVYEYLALTAVT